MEGRQAVGHAVAGDKDERELFGDGGRRRLDVWERGGLDMGSKRGRCTVGLRPEGNIV